MSDARRESRRLLIGLGNVYRGDDGAGIFVARALGEEDIARLRVIESVGDPLALIDAWQGRETVVVDAMSSDRAPGTVASFDALAEPLPARDFVAFSSHSVGLSETVELARALNRMPVSLHVYGIEGSRFDHGEGMSPPVRESVSKLAQELRERWLVGVREERRA